MYAFLIRLIADERGATAIEYGLIAALIAVAAVSVMTTVGHTSRRRSIQSPRISKDAGRRGRR